MANLTGFLRDNKGAYIFKDPDANLVYGVDFTDYLNAGDNLTSATITIQTITGDSSPLQHPTAASTDVSISGNSQVNIRLEGGTAGNEYTIDTKVVTANGDTDSRRFRIIVQRKHL
jgi:hypothetical protein|tara:strand:- start:530 stop:877 length:348 start_codon:yes stop_codon:yes gene_type:complete